MATVDNDIIKITLSNTASGNVITVSPGISALSSVSLSLNDLSNVDTSGITNGQTIVYENGNFVAGDAGAVKTVNNENPDVNGNVDISLNDVSQVSITTPSNNEFLKYSAGQWVNDEIEISYVNGLQTALDDKATISSVPQGLNDLSDVTISGTPSGNQALLYDATTSSFKALASYTNRFEDDVEFAKNAIDTASSIFIERSYSVKSDGDGIFIDPNPDTPTSGNVIVRKIYHKSGFITSSDVIGDYTLIHTFADDTAYSSTVSTFEGFRDGNTYGTAPFTLIQVWEEQAAAPAFTGLLNESYGSGAAAAYSVRRLNGNYTGSAVQLERTSDNSFQDIGFDVNGDLDESAITTFCTGTTCKVRTWYDQSGNANNAVQTNHNNQPTIYTGGAIVKQDGKVSMTFDGADDYLATSTIALNTSDIALFNVLKLTSATFATWFSYGGYVSDGFLIQRPNTDAIRYAVSGSAFKDFGSYLTSTTARLLISLIDFATNARVYVDSTLVQQNNITASLTSSKSIEIGRRADNGTQYTPMNAQEFIFYASDKSTDRTSIESNIGDYFTQNTPLLDTYSGAAAAYSLRKLRSAYTGAAIEVYNGTSYQDIGFNVFGELDTVSLAAFCGGNNGFVSKWYDQSGNANDATQTATGSQPKIYDSVTGVVTENGKPAVQFDGSNDNFEISITNSASDYSLFTVTTTSDTDYFFFDSQTGRLILLSRGSGRGPIYDGTFRGTPHTGTSQQLETVFAVAPTSGESYVNGSQINSSLTYTQKALGGTIILGSNYAGLALFYEGKVQDFVLYASDQSSNRTGIESNINTFYSIY